MVVGHGVAAGRSPGHDADPLLVKDARRSRLLACTRLKWPLVPAQIQRRGGNRDLPHAKGPYALAGTAIQGAHALGDLNSRRKRSMSGKTITELDEGDH